MIIIQMGKSEIQPLFQA